VDISTRLCSSSDNRPSVWGFLLFLLFLALRQHFLGETLVWYCPVTSYPWFNSYDKYSSKLPPPVTVRAGRGTSRSRLYAEKEFGGTARRPSRSTPRDGERGRTSWRPQRAPAKAITTDRSDKPQFPTHIHDKFARGASPRRF
jgi:hypothetical protein